VEVCDKLADSLNGSQVDSLQLGKQGFVISRSRWSVDQHHINIKVIHEQARQDKHAYSSGLQAQ
jgi:hypothetical protein